MAKLIVIEGCDCFSKEEQSKVLVERLNKEGIKALRLSFPMYDSPTGKIVGACYLGREDMCKKYLNGSGSFFDEGASMVDPITSSLLYAADRRYNLPVIEKAMDEYDIVVLDRYTYSNMAYQAGKIENSSERTFMFQILEHLEFNVCRLPRADKVIFLNFPYNYEYIKENKGEDECVHLKNAIDTYLLLADYYNFDTIDCGTDNGVKTDIEISDEIYRRVIDLVK